MNQNGISPEELERDLAFAIDAAREPPERRVHGATRAWGAGRARSIGRCRETRPPTATSRACSRGAIPTMVILSEETADSARPAREGAHLDRRSARRDEGVQPACDTTGPSTSRSTVGGRSAPCRAVALPAEDLVSPVGRLRPAGPRARGRQGTAGELRRPVGLRGPDRKPRMVVCSRSHTPPWVEAFAAVDRTPSSFRCARGASATRSSRLLRGRSGRLRPQEVGLKEWDTCAPEVRRPRAGLVRVRSCAATSTSTTSADPKNHELVVCRPAMRERVLEALAKSGALED